MKTNELKCTDLRIGNYLKYDDEIIQVSKLCKNYVEFYDKEDLLIGDNPNEFQPIELTEDVMDMIRCEDKYADGYSPVYSLREGFYVKCRGRDGSLDFVKIDSTYLHIKYLHQLQNCYYVLCYKELEVEL